MRKSQKLVLAGSAETAKVPLLLSYGKKSSDSIPIILVNMTPYGGRH